MTLTIIDVYLLRRPSLYIATAVSIEHIPRSEDQL